MLSLCWTHRALTLGTPLKDALGRLSAAGTLPPVSGAGFFSSVTQAVSAADSLQPRTWAVVWSRLTARLPAERSRSPGFGSKRSHPARCGQGVLAAKGGWSRICSQKAKPAGLLCWRKVEEELFRSEAFFFFFRGLLETDAVGNGLIMSSSWRGGGLSRIDGGDTTKCFLSDTACDFHLTSKDCSVPGGGGGGGEGSGWSGRGEKWEHLGVTRSRYQRDAELCPLLSSSSCPPGPGTGTLSTTDP